MLNAEHEAYLRSRGYNDALLAEDKPFSVNGSLSRHGLRIEHEGGAIGWDVRSMSGDVLGILTREYPNKKYRWAQVRGFDHVPNWMGSDWDQQQLYETGCCVLAEGILDRVALKRLWPRKVPIFARLSKGIGKQLGIHMSRYATRIVTVFDNDEPGQEATAAIAKLFPHAESFNLPSKDPSKFLESYGEVKGRVLLKKRLETLNDDLS